MGGGKKIIPIQYHFDIGYEVYLRVSLHTSIHVQWKFADSQPTKNRWHSFVILISHSLNFIHFVVLNDQHWIAWDGMHVGKLSAYYNGFGQDNLTVLALVCFFLPLFTNAIALKTLLFQSIQAHDLLCCFNLNFLRRSFIGIQEMHTLNVRVIWLNIMAKHNRIVFHLFECNCAL